MKRDELHSLLNVEYEETRGYGIENVEHPDYENIWFVIPRPLPQDMEFTKKMPKKQLIGLLAKSRRILNEAKPFSGANEIDRLAAKHIIRQEALASSRIEGTYSTIDEVFTRQGDDDASQDTLSIIGYARAMEEVFKTVLQEGHAGISCELFQNIHRAIVTLDKGYRGLPGEFRSSGVPGSIVQIGGLRRKEESSYNPAPPRHVKRLMEDFVCWLSNPNMQEDDDAGFGIPLPLRMVIAHAHFEAIHPFTDANGRVGRVIWPIQMILAGLSPIHISGFIEVEKDGYYAGLEAYQKRLDPMPLLDYMGTALTEAKIEEDKTKKALAELPVEWRAKISARRDSTAEKLIQHLISMPVLGVEEVIKHQGVSLPTAVAALKQLKSDGILVEITGRQRRQKYAAEDVLAILGRPFGQRPDETLAIARRKRMITL